MRNITTIIIKLLGSALLIYFLFVIIFSTVPNMLPKKLSNKTKQSLNTVQLASTNHTPSGEKALLISDTDDAYNIRVKMIQDATETINFAVHTIQKGESTEALLGEFLNAANRGVTVRIVIDGKLGATAKSVSSALNLLANHDNISLYNYNPISFLKPWRLHTLFHDKFMVVDDTYLLLGGRNLGDRYFAPKSYTGNKTDDYDVFICQPSSSPIQGSAIGQVNTYFTQIIDAPEKQLYSPRKINENIQSTILNQAKTLPVTNPQLYQNTLQSFTQAAVDTNKITLVHNPLMPNKKEATAAYQIARLAHLAQQEVVLQTPYSTANKQVLSAFSNIADKVPFTLLTNSLASTPNIPGYSTYYSQRGKFLQTGATIYEYQNTSSIHGKAMLVDDTLAAVGSLNMDDRSLHLSTETMLIIDSPKFNRQLRGAMQQYQNSSLIVGQNNAYIPSQSVQEVSVPQSKKTIILLASVLFRIFQPLI